MNLDDLTLGELKTLKNLLGGKESSCDIHPFPVSVGNNTLIRTVTMIVLGKVEAVGRYEITLSGAAWIADTGRYSEMLRTGKAGEVEPYPEGIVFVGRGAIVDGCLWNHALLREVK